MMNKRVIKQLKEKMPRVTREDIYDVTICDKLPLGGLPFNITLEECYIINLLVKNNINLHSLAGKK